ncbi:N-acetylmuramoyl-L-alanine amidase [Candidatus Vampirococcus lugosii]|uniref:N-acetylmuramoyl-L-alanine amidase n=1 Tax=Candidatus Vampirococcus lugosii TaxID=2789015 RepID=A0ABS5QN87_9BACT|nr:N-acetylmuramoyl-L-alanine amidase [Candidatus Vampirococcus lugosii]
MKKIIILLFMFLPYINFANWNLDGVDIINRSQRGADESLRYYDNHEYQDILKRKEEYEKYLKELYNEDYQAYLNATKKSRINEKRNKYVLQNNPSSIRVDKTINNFNGNKLRWPNSYFFDKNSIIIHHTANDYTKFKNKQEVEVFLRNIYRSHSITNGWGDIGYNFVIDHFGNIYEGKSGGEGIVGAHAVWNNTSSIGISLIGHFDIQKPTKEQLISLTKLLVSLSDKYNINPKKQNFYNKPSNNSPYMNIVGNYPIVGHRDVGSTACPGKNLYNLLPKIRDITSLKLDKIKLSSYKKNTENNINTEKINKDIKKHKDIKAKSSIFISSNKKTLNIESEASEIMKYTNDKDSIFLSNFDIINGNIQFDIEYKKYNASGKHKIFIETDKEIINYEINLVWQKDLYNIMKNKKDNYLKNIENPLTNNRMKKIKSKINLNDAINYLTKNVKVLLYELSSKFNTYEISCTSSCDLEIDAINFENINNLTINKNGNFLKLYIDGKKYYSSYINLINNEGFIVFENYDRKSYGGIPWNKFRGNINIKRDLIKPIGKKVKTDWTLVNDLPFFDYMKGIVETNDQEHIEKNKLMSLISKNYMLFYFDKSNEHPSIPSNAKYNAIDDARIFQKYGGAGVEDTLTKWYSALEQTWNEIVYYDNYIPILPYYNCSSGFTWSAEERFGWIDTSYLQSKIDFFSCDKFNGHGVGLSGRGSEFLANNGLNYKQILKYYYIGVDIYE